jgi:nucleoside-diphosphate-sugar epimerase
MDLLVIGGTHFVGRAIVEDAAVRGFRVTVFHRGESEPGDLPSVEHIHGDRDGDLSVLGGRRWDTVIDVCAYFPAQVRALGAALTPPGHYVLISSLSVHDEDLPAGANEDSPLLPVSDPDVTEITEDTYGPLKVACEIAAREAFPGSGIIRPGYVVGPHDTTDRFTYWVRRAAAGGRMLVPGVPDEPIQFIDARDLAAFTLDRALAKDPGAYGVVRPVGESTMGSVLHAAATASGADTEFVWVPESFLLPALGDDVWAALPMWHPQLHGSHRYDPSRALAAGLRCRPLADTVADTFGWDRARGEIALQAGLAPERERDLLERWAGTRV